MGGRGGDALLSSGQPLKTWYLVTKVRNGPEIYNSANFCFKKIHTHKTIGNIYPNENKKAVVLWLEGVSCGGERNGRAYAEKRECINTENRRGVLERTVIMVHKLRGLTPNFAREIENKKEFQGAREM